MSAAAPTAADPERLVAALREVGPRPACSDGERRAARLLARELRQMGRRPRTETVWVRPQWAAVWLVHALAGVAASVVSPTAPGIALGVVAGATLSALAESAGVPALSLLWPRRATQNVIAGDPRRHARATGLPAAADAGSAQPHPTVDGKSRTPHPGHGGTVGEPRRRPVRLLVTAAYDAPRRRTPLAAPLRRAEAVLRRATGGWWPSPLGLLTLSLLALTGCVGARLAGVEAVWLGGVQVVPTVVCIGAVALLADLAVAVPASAPSPSASAPAAVLALVVALDCQPPRRIAVDVVLAGAGDAMALGMRRYVRKQTRATRPEDVAVLHVEPCGAGMPVVWRRDGAMLPLALHPQLVAAAAASGFRPYAGPGMSGASAARRARWPAVAVGRLDAHAQAPDDLNAAALRDTVDRCLALVRRLDDELARHART